MQKMNVIAKISCYVERSVVYNEIARIIFKYSDTSLTLDKNITV